MEREKNGRVISIGDLWNVLLWHAVPILLAVIVCVGGLYVYATYFRTPKYQSTATLYILKQEREGDYVYTSSDFSLALNVVNDCTYMLKSHAVLDDVIDELDLTIGYKTLANSISTNNPEGSRILEISVESDSAQQAKKIVDSICRIGSKKISDAMSVDQVNIYDVGTLNNVPSNSIGLSRYVLVGLSAAVLVYVLYLTAFLLDDKVKTEEDVQKYLNLSVLGNIPNADKSKRSKNRYGKYYRYSKYEKYKEYSYGGVQKDAADGERGGSDHE